MYEIGDYVIFTEDGARGVVLRVQDGQCQVLWEDYFVSWEKSELLIPWEKPEHLNPGQKSDL